MESRPLSPQREVPRASRGGELPAATAKSPDCPTRDSR